MAGNSSISAVPAQGDGPGGESARTLCSMPGLDADALTVLQFCELLAEKTGVPAQEQELLAGFPPTALQLPLDPAASHLSKLPLATGDSIVVRRREGAAAAAPAAAPAVQHADDMATPAAAPRPSGATNGEAAAASHDGQLPSREVTYFATACMSGHACMNAYFT